ncbi:hypothetical protein MesoLj113a_68480 [Mesorhizobium sp. 113-1-2]|nr:conjugation TrbI family protein [Mesorhizobium loti]BCG75690.1 hypothetical protein MesoLj113a_68480 [Mesorhizobium sp. 113-1-2]
MNENEVAAAPMQIRAEPPRVTRLSRKVLAGIGLCASLGVGGTLIYALQTSETGRHGDELYSTSNRQPADGLASLPRDRSWAAAAWRSWPADA